MLRSIPDGTSVDFSVRAEMPNGEYTEVKGDGDVMKLVEILKQRVEPFCSKYME